MVGRWRPGRRLTSPHEQHLTRRVIDDEPRVRAEALGTGAQLPVTSHDEHVGTRTRLDHLALDPPAPGVQLRGAHLLCALANTNVPSS